MSSVNSLKKKNWPCGLNSFAGDFDMWNESKAGSDRVREMEDWGRERGIRVRCFTRLLTFTSPWFNSVSLLEAAQLPTCNPSIKHKERGREGKRECKGIKSDVYRETKDKIWSKNKPNT